jgi:decaprenyl-phosphate phosphoribosyltransferase
MATIAADVRTHRRGSQAWIRAVRVRQWSKNLLVVTAPVAGGVSAQVGVSRWFVLVISFVALFVAAGKRYADVVDPAARRSRAVLTQYTPEFLRIVIGVACGAALTAYALWAFQMQANAVLARELTLVPFTLALLRYTLLVSQGGGGAPEAVLFRDRFLQCSGTVWLLLFLIGA